MAGVHPDDGMDECDVDVDNEPVDPRVEVSCLFSYVCSQNNMSDSALHTVYGCENITFIIIFYFSFFVIYLLYTLHNNKVY